MLTTFDGKTPDLDWQTMNDNVMGGRSKGGFRVDDGILHFAGSTNTNGGGFSSIRSRGPLDLGSADGIEIRVRGDGRTYIFRLESRDTRASYWAEFPTQSNAESNGDWEVVQIPFSAFWPNWRGRRLEGPALDPSRVASLGLMIYDGRDGAFTLDVDWIKAYDAQPVSG